MKPLVLTYVKAAMADILLKILVTTLSLASSHSESLTKSKHAASEVRIPDL